MKKAKLLGLLSISAITLCSFVFSACLAMAEETKEAKDSEHSKKDSDKSEQAVCVVKKLDEISNCKDGDIFFFAPDARTAQYLVDKGKAIDVFIAAYCDFDHTIYDAHSYGLGERPLCVFKKKSTPKGFLPETENKKEEMESERRR